MKMAKLVVLAVIGCLSTAVLTFGQFGGSSGAKFAHEQEAMKTYYQKLHQEISHELKEIRHALVDQGDPFRNERTGVAKLDELSHRITQHQEELAESKRMISRGESKQKVIRLKLVRIENDLGRSLKHMPNDPVAQALQKLVEIDESASQRMKKKFEMGQISADELSNSERKLAQSRLELAKHQWDESAEARKALAAASSALEEAVFETEMQVTESAELVKEIETLKIERGRIDGLVREESELTQQSAAVEQLLGLFRIGDIDGAERMIEKLRKMGVKVYEPGKKEGQATESSKNPGK